MSKAWGAILTLLFYPSWMPKDQIHGDYDCKGASVFIDTDLEQIKVVQNNYVKASGYSTLTQRGLTEESFMIQMSQSSWMAFNQNGTIYLMTNQNYECTKI